MIRVTIYKLGDDGDAAVGTIAWDGQALLLDPEGDELLAGILEIRGLSPDFAVLTAKDDPEAWLTFVAFAEEVFAFLDFAAGVFEAIFLLTASLTFFEIACP